MTDITVHTGVPAGAAAPPAPFASRPQGRGRLGRLVRRLGSLRITVVLFAMAIFLVFAGTLAQIDKGLWDVLEQYFRAPIARVELKIFFPRAWAVPGAFFFPGGWLIGGALLVNLVVAHGTRFRIVARGRSLAVGFGVVAAGVVLTWVVIQRLFEAEGAQATLGPSMRILWQLIQGAAAGGVLLGGCVVLFRRQAGMVLLHAGIVLMMANELVVYGLHSEAHMRLRVGEGAPYAVDNRTAELAVIDPSDPREDDVVVVPGSLLRAGRRVCHDLLPFDVDVLSYMPNSEIVGAFAGQAPGAIGPNPATRGDGMRARAVPRSPASGVAESQSVDVPSAYVKLCDKRGGAAIGTWLVSVYLNPQSVEVGGRAYRVSLRFTQRYLYSKGSRTPFSIRLKEFRHTKYPGTDRPKDFSSFVRLVDPDRGVDRDVRIWMNNPLRYADKTLYQASFDPEDDQVTVLQVVHNTGWMIPYVACMIVATGMLSHFAISLVAFLCRKVAA